MDYDVHVSSVLADVVPEVDDEVEIFFRHVFVGRVVAVLVLLARGEREPELGDFRAWRRAVLVLLTGLLSPPASNL